MEYNLKTNPRCCAVEPQLLWEEGVTRPNGAPIGWYTIWCMPDTRHPHLNNPKLMVTYDDLEAKKKNKPELTPHRPAYWRYDITDKAIGRALLDDWKTKNPEKLRALPTTHKEYVKGVFTFATDAMVAEWCAEADVVDTTITYEKAGDLMEYMRSQHNRAFKDEFDGEAKTPGAEPTDEIWEKL